MNTNAFETKKDAVIAAHDSLTEKTPSLYVWKEGEKYHVGDIDDTEIDGVLVRRRTMIECEYSRHFGWSRTVLELPKYVTKKVSKNA